VPTTITPTDTLTTTTTSLMNMLLFSQGDSLTP
jgi:hypothetical protein